MHKNDAQPANDGCKYIVRQCNAHS